MIVDECDKYELPDITDSWVRSRIVSGREGGGGGWKFKGVRTKSNQLNVFFIYHFQHIH